MPASLLSALIPGLDDPARGRRLVGFGSSNTELTWHNEGALSWFAWLSCCARARIGRHLLCIDAGICGNTVLDLEARFDRDVSPLEPDAVIVTIGGNDQARLPLAEYQAGLRRVLARIRALGAVPIVQSYYCPVFDEAQLSVFARFMAAAIAIAREDGAIALDPFPAWRAVFAAQPGAYQAWMHDPAHLGPLGHALFGARCAAELGLGEPEFPAALATKVATARALF